MIYLLSILIYINHSKMEYIITIIGLIIVFIKTYKYMKLMSLFRYFNR